MNATPELTSDVSLSFKARGIYNELLKMADPQLQVPSAYARLCDISPDGRHAVRTGLHELEEAGYVTCHRDYDPQKRHRGATWQIHPHLAPKEAGVGAAIAA